MLRRLGMKDNYTLSGKIKIAIGYSKKRQPVAIFRLVIRYKYKSMNNFFVLENNNAAENLLRLRNRTTGIEEFRENALKVADSLVKFAVSDITYSKNFVVIAILRSALALLPASLKYLPSAKVGFAGLARDEKTAIAKEYYWKAPDLKGKSILIPDPMLATGGSILHVLRKIKGEEPKEIRIASIVSAPEGVKAIQKEFPDVKIFTMALDEGLDSKKFIVPGLGDFGDRYFGTE